MIKLMNAENLSDCTLLIPAVAVGNVSQLTIDLIISNGRFKKIGHIMTPCFIPIIGGNPYIANSAQLCTSCDIYHNCEKKLIAIQIRSPVIKKLNVFFQAVKHFIDNHQIAKVIILTSGWAHTRTDAQIQSEPMRYMASPAFLSEKLSQQIANSNWIELEKTQGIYGGAEDVRIIPGGGFASQLFQLLNDNGIPAAILLRFCSEGDNIPDAIALMNYLCKWLSLDTINDINIPNSWKFLFGKPAPISLY